MPTLREQAERRIADLDAKERERKIRQEDHAERARQTQAADAQERRVRQAADAEHAAQVARARLASRLGSDLAAKIIPGLEYFAFVLPHRGFAVAFARVAAEPRSAPRVGGPRPAAVLAAAGPRSRSWALQASLQRALNVGVDMPTIVVGERLDQLGYPLVAIDPDATELADLAAARSTQPRSL